MSAGPRSDNAAPPGFLAQAARRGASAVALAGLATTAATLRPEPAGAQAAASAPAAPAAATPLSLRIVGGLANVNQYTRSGAAPARDG